MTKLKELIEKQRTVNESEKTRAELKDRLNDFFDGVDFRQRNEEKGEVFEFSGCIVIKISIFDYYACFEYDYSDSNGQDAGGDNYDITERFDFATCTADEIINCLVANCETELDKTAYL